jgi:hypothetical protein
MYRCYWTYPIPYGARDAEQRSSYARMFFYGYCQLPVKEAICLAVVSGEIAQCNCIHQSAALRLILKYIMNLIMKSIFRMHLQFTETGRECQEFFRGGPQSSHISARSQDRDRSHRCLRNRLGTIAVFRHMNGHRRHHRICHRLQPH